jgi:uncharacterized membrane protein
MMEKSGADKRLENAMGNLLRIGLMIASGVVLIGGIVFIVRHGSEHPDYRVFRSQPLDLRTLSGIMSEASQGSGRGIIQLGILLLLATPLARVIAALIGFAIEKDRLYVIISAIVLAVLCFSIFAEGI